MFNVPPLAAIVAQMLASSDDDIRALGWNLQHDIRISPERCSGFLNYANTTGRNLNCPLSLRDTMKFYHADRVRGEMDPDFLNRSLNQLNFHGGSTLPEIHGDRLLVRVINLSGLKRVFVASTGFNELSGLHIADPNSPADSVTDFIDDKLAWLKTNPAGCFDATKLKNTLFLQQLLDQMNLHRRSEAFQPVWATCWEEFSKMDYQDPSRWNQLLGVQTEHTATKPSWLLLLRYPAREAAQIVRPTQLDSGWYPEHFPTPPGAPKGHAMDLDRAKPPATPLAEYIHQQIDHEQSHILACARVAPSGRVRLPPPRERHFDLLCRDYSDAAAWAPYRPS